jgi:hypothetical protein
MTVLVRKFSRSGAQDIGSALTKRKAVVFVRHSAVLRLMIATLLTGCLMTSAVVASTWTNVNSNDDWNDLLNWGAGDFTGGVGVIPDQAGSVGVAVGAVPLTISQSGLNSLYMIVNNQVDITGGDLVYTGDGLWGSGIGAAGGGDPDPDVDPPMLGSATINQTGGTLTQTGGGAGFLVGHNRSATYNISGGTVIVEAGAPGLIVDFAYPEVGSSSNPSELNISGNGVVDIWGPRFALGPQGTLNITDDGLLIWRDHTLVDLAGTITYDAFPEGANGPRPVLDPGSVLNARALQVGPDVFLVAVPDVIPEPAGIVLLAIAGMTLVARRR